MKGWIPPKGGPSTVSKKRGVLIFGEDGCGMHWEGEVLCGGGGDK